MTLVLLPFRTSFKSCEVTLHPYSDPLDHFPEMVWHVYNQFTLWDQVKSLEIRGAALIHMDRSQLGWLRNPTVIFPQFRGLLVTICWTELKGVDPGLTEGIYPSWLGNKGGLLGERLRKKLEACLTHYINPVSTKILTWTSGFGE